MIYLSNINQKGQLELFTPKVGRIIVAIILTSIVLAPCILLSQSETSNTKPAFLVGKVHVTNNGLSFVPTFSLNKPAFGFDFSAGKNRFSFDPDFRFDLSEGKPWSFLMRARYKLFAGTRFNLKMGSAYGLNFRTIPIISNERTKDIIESRRFLHAEIIPSYKVSKNLSIGMYFLFSRGLDNSFRKGRFFVLSAAAPAIKIVNDIRLGFFPTVYSLRLDELKGYYVAATFRLYKKGFPLALESIINQQLNSEILPDMKTVWNVSLICTFSNKYNQHRKGKIL